MRGSIVESSISCEKLLGIHAGSNFSFENHINRTCRKQVKSFMHCLELQNTFPKIKNVCYSNLSIQCLWQWDTTYFSSSDWSTLIFCWLTSPPCCNSPRKCTPVKYMKKQKAVFPIVRETLCFTIHILSMGGCATGRGFSNKINNKFSFETLLRRDKLRQFI